MTDVQRWMVLAIVVLLAVRLQGGETRLGPHTFTLPDEFEIDVAASQPMVERPITADFDEQGRLYVAESSGSNENVQKQLQEKPHRILRLADTDGDGRFDQQTVFADQLMFPEGTLWYDGSLYVAAPPSIWKLTDTDADGIADQREEWFKGKTLTGCANDLHGPYLGRDGWIYWCKGAFAEQRYELAGGKEFLTRASHIFRCRPDGSGLEPVMTGGMDNPVDVVFTRGGERIFTTTFLQHPGGGNRDGLIHAIYGGVYGKVHDVLNGHVRTSDGVMPVLCHLGAAAPAGLTTYESQAFGGEYQSNLFTALFNMHKVTRHVLGSDGATYATEVENFLVADDTDFHPTDAIEDADGSLLVVDTGGWYKLCCPTSQLVKPDVLGAIYRVRRSGAARLEDPRGLKFDWPGLSPEQLVDLLGDPRVAVRRRAIHALGKSGEDALAALETALEGSKSADARLNAVWAATRIDAARARAVTRIALGDDDETVRLSAIHSASVWRDAGALAPLCDLVDSDKSAGNRRAAAEALGRLGVEKAVASLLRAAEQADDAVLEHSLTYALIEIGKPESVRAGLASENATVQRVALVALDQMGDSGLKPRGVIAFLDSRDERLRKTAEWVLSRNPDWGETVVQHFANRLDDRAAMSPERRGTLAAQLARFSTAVPMQRLLAKMLLDRDSASRRDVALSAMNLAGPKETPDAWIDGLARTLASADTQELPKVVATIKTLRISSKSGQAVQGELGSIAADEKRPMDVRIAALGASTASGLEISDELFVYLKSQLSAESTIEERGAAVDILARAKLSGERLLSLTENVAIAGPTEIERLVLAFGQSANNKVGQALLVALEKSPSFAAVRTEVLTSSLSRCSEYVRRQAEQLSKSRVQTTEEQTRQLEDLLAMLPKGDIRRGQAVFNSTKAACTSCHAIGYLGGKLGPDLTKIGEVRTERDLLEAILFPSASFVRSYEPLAVLKTNGTIVSGLVRKDTLDEIVLATSATEEQRVPRSEIEEVRGGNTSIMPAGLDGQLTREQLADLVVFLKACR